MKDESLICCKYLIYNTLVVQGLAHRESCAMGLGFKSCNIFRSPNFLGISNIFVKVFVVVENCLYIF